MKKLTPALCFLFIAFQTLAQTDDQTSYHSEIGINFTRFLDEAIDFGGSDTEVNPYLFTYKRINESGKGFRFGAGFSASRTKGEQDLGNFFDEEVKFSNSSIDMRLGSEQQRSLSKRWLYYYGFDGLIGFNHNTIKNSDAKIINQNFRAGLGPVLGAQFMISEKVGLFTEASFYLIQSFGSEKTDVDFEEEENDKFNSTALNFQIPTNIYLFFRF